jgi:hypothetical protein
MTRNLIAMLALGAGVMLAGSRDGYGRYDDGAYDSRHGSRYGDRYDPDGYAAPAPPRGPVHGPHFRRPPMPGHGFVWVEGYWSFARGRYVWVNSYWARPPFAGAYWVAPRYHGGRHFVGFWSGRDHRHGGAWRNGRGYGHGYRR